MSKLILSWLLKMVLTNNGHEAPILPNCSKIVVAPSLARKNIQKPSMLPLRHRFSEWRSCSEWFCLFCYLSGRSQTGSIEMVNYGTEICLNTLRIVISVHLLVWTRYGCSLGINFKHFYFLFPWEIYILARLRYLKQPLTKCRCFDNFVYSN